METSQDAIAIVLARDDKGLNYGYKEVDELKKYLQAKIGKTQPGLRCGE